MLFPFFHCLGCFLVLFSQFLGWVFLVFFSFFFVFFISIPVFLFVIPPFFHCFVFVLYKSVLFVSFSVSLFFFVFVGFHWSFFSLLFSYFSFVFFISFVSFLVFTVFQIYDVHFFSNTSFKHFLNRWSTFFECTVNICLLGINIFHTQRRLFLYIKNISIYMFHIYRIQN